MLKLHLVGPACLLLILPLAGCGGQKTANENAAPPASAPAGGVADTAARLDQGPRAAESAVDETAARQGEALFDARGCSGCHGFGKRVSGPDLAGVSQRRTAQWLESQLLHPDQMAKEDPIASDLVKQFSLEMPDPGLTQAEARAVLEFLKHKDRAAGGSGNAGK